MELSLFFFWKTAYKGHVVKINQFQFVVAANFDLSRVWVIKLKGILKQFPFRFRFLVFQKHLLFLWHFLTVELIESHLFQLQGYVHTMAYQGSREHEQLPNDVIPHEQLF